MSVIVYQFQTVKFIQMMSLTFGLFTQVSGSGPLGPLVYHTFFTNRTILCMTRTAVAAHICLCHDIFIFARSLERSLNT